MTCKTTVYKITDNNILFMYFALDIKTLQLGLNISNDIVPFFILIFFITMYMQKIPHSNVKRTVNLVLFQIRIKGVIIFVLFYI